MITVHPSIPEVDLATEDVLFNSITTETQLCRQSDGKPWRGAKEKSEVVLKLFIHGLSLVGGIVADMTTSTGIMFYIIQLLVYMFSNLYFNVYIFLINIVLHPCSSIIAVHSSNCHILAWESDAVLFDEVLKPLHTPTIDTSCDGIDFDDDMPIGDAALLNLCE